jgi:GrpB-like predicted nucleotidyltransferase (UPF0157 family)
MRVGSIEYKGSRFKIHVHVISRSSSEVGEMRHFREELRRDERMRESYIEMKREILRSGVTDSVEYSNKKGEFIREVLGSEERQKEK